MTGLFEGWQVSSRTHREFFLLASRSVLSPLTPLLSIFRDPSIPVSLTMKRFIRSDPFVPTCHRAAKLMIPPSIQTLLVETQNGSPLSVPKLEILTETDDDVVHSPGERRKGMYHHGMQVEKDEYEGYTGAGAGGERTTCVSSVSEEQVQMFAGARALEKVRKTLTDASSN